jgi:hypothetical protein
MRKTILGLCLLVSTSGMAMATTAPAPSVQDATAARAPQSAQVLRDVLKGLVAMAGAPRSQADDVQMRTLLKAVIEDPAFPSLAANERHTASVMYGAALVDANDYAGALGVLRPASEMAEAAPIDWELRFSAAWRTGDYEDAARSLTTLARRWPRSVSECNAKDIAALGHEIDKNPAYAKLHEDLMAALTAAGWTSPEI